MVGWRSSRPECNQPTRCRLGWRREIQVSKPKQQQKQQHRQQLTRLGVALAVEHDLRCSIPSGGDILGEEAGVIVLGVGHSRQAKVADLEVAGGVQQKVRRLQVAVQHVGRVDVLEAAQYLVEEVADVIVRDLLRLQQLVQVGLHQALHDVHVSHALDARRADDLANVDDLVTEEEGGHFD